MKTYLLALIISLFTLPLHAGVSLPSSFVELHGAFKGAGVNSKKTAHLLVYKITEDGVASGRFFVFLLSEDKKKGQIFDAEWIGGEALGLISTGKSANGKYLDPKLPPAGILEKSLDRKLGQVLKLNKQNSSSALTESYVFHRDSDDVMISNQSPVGLYSDRNNQVVATVGDRGTLNVDTLVPDLRHEGKFVGVFELDGVVVLRKQVLDDSLLTYNEGEISGVMVAIVDGRKQSVVLGSISSDGTPVTVKLLKRSR